jgi:hypothetical protein
LVAKVLIKTLASQDSKRLVFRCLYKELELRI